MQMRVDVSVLILTLDEEVNLPRCLYSLDWCNDVVVLDSCSADKTQELANEWGARVVERPFDNYAAQRNYGLKETQYKNPWVLMVDADEVVPRDLVEEMAVVISDCSEDITLFRMRRKDHFMGQWIRRSSGYPTWFGRLVRPERVQVEREINEEFVTDGHVAMLENHLLHYPFNKGFAAWFEKHNRYSTMEAEFKSQGSQESLSLVDLFSKDPASRRRFIKSLVYRLPFRPLLMFFALYIVRGGFLDGRAGLTFCLLRSFYEFMINCKIVECKLRKQGEPL